MFRVAHISDLHVAPLPDAGPGQLASKRILGFLSWHTRRKHEHLTKILDALLADLAAGIPDHVCVTGDLTNITLPGEVDNATKWLERLGDPHKVSVIPGNHDAYVEGAIDFALERWAPWMRDDEGRAGFPFLHRRGPVNIIGLSSAVATLPTLSLGRIGRDQAARLEALLAATTDETRARLVMVHHPPQEGAASWRRGLADRHLLQEVLHRHQVDAVLHGHLHVPVRGTVTGPRGPIPVLGAGSASALGHRKSVAQYHMIEVEPGDGRPRLFVRHHLYDPASGQFRAGERERVQGDENSACHSRSS